MADDSLEHHLSRLAAIVAPLVETVNQHDARLALHEVHIARQDAINERLALAIERLETLLARMIPQQGKGRDA